MSTETIPQTITLHEKLQVLNEKYKSLLPHERVAELFSDFDRSEVLLTTSFGTTSVCLLHLFAKHNHPAHFINTSYHFPETLAYKNKLVELYNINMVELNPDAAKNKMTQEQELWKTNPDGCCGVNKVTPLKEIKSKFNVWASGLMAYQNPHRKDMRIFQHDGDIIKFSPLIDVDEDFVNTYALVNELPPHPLRSEGYDSVGCTHCTQKGTGRNGRWFGFNKTECGLHA